MDLPVELVQLLKHEVIDGQKLTWDLQVNSNVVSVKVVWIKSAKPADNTGETTSLAQKRSNSPLPPAEDTPNVWSSRRRKGKPLVTIQLVFKHRQLT
jgi:hypothetical protein